jgi:hypothetical protein
MSKKRTDQEVTVLHVLPTRESSIDPDKYITFKREELQTTFPLPFVRTLRELEIEDAVVIRTQDAFAGPALHAYAASISIAAKVLFDTGSPEQATALQDIADYFSLRAEEADAGPQKIPD